MLQILFIFSALSPAQAAKPLIRSGPEVKALYLHTAQEVPGALLRRSVTTVGGLKLTGLVAETAKLEWFEIENMLAGGSGDTRFSGVNFRGQGKVYLNKIYWDQTPVGIRPILALHEALEAIGYEDENYNLSLGLWLTNRQTARGRAVSAGTRWLVGFEHPARSRQPRQYYTNGTISGVGSGGDQYEIRLKVAMLLLLEKYEKKLGRGANELQFELSRAAVMELRVLVGYDVDHPRPLRAAIRQSEISLAIPVNDFFGRSDEENAGRALQAIGALGNQNGR